LSQAHSPSAVDDDSRASLRRGVYWLLAMISIGAMVGRILAVNAVDKAALSERLRAEGRDDWQRQRPFLSANDRSRWCTVRALVEHGTYAIDQVVTEPNWDTIDMVKHDGHLYSSKPPLLPTLLAAPYWVIHRLTGTTLATHPYEIGRPFLVAVNVGGMAIYFFFMARIVEQLGTTDWGRVFVMACAAFGTFLTTFAVVINNHLVAAVCTTVALYAALGIWYQGRRHAGWFAACGFFAAMAAANELPALSLLVGLGTALAWKAPREVLFAFTPAALVVVVAFFGTNYAAHGTLIPAYAHRGDGDNWYDYTYESGGKVRESYWRNPGGIDGGERSPARYALHVLVGHHGIFSLSPIWLLSVVGMGIAVVGRGSPTRALALFVALISIACVTFYLTRPLGERNYGGMTSAFRWVFWLAPCWLAVMPPAADMLSRFGWARFTALVCLAISVLSANYPTWNPWSHPWPWNLLKYLGWM